ncbi:MAG: DUF92 domain-containing protein [Spirochaetaceae bacterium]|nr:DUF92 domain-containing protein [Spirochaetaceae bacterium]
MAVYGLGLPWLIPVAAFFLTSVALTKINSRVYRKISESECRNIWQVCANIAVATMASGLFLAVGRSFWRRLPVHLEFPGLPCLYFKDRPNPV